MKTSTELDTEAGNKAIIRRLYDECLNRGRLEIAEQFISPAFVVPGPDGSTGPEGFKANAARLRTGFPDVHFIIQNLIAENEWVALCWTWEGTHRGMFANIPATGKRVRQEGTVMYRLEAGKAVEAKLIFDRFGVFQQLGALPPGLPVAPTNAKPFTA